MQRRILSVLLVVVVLTVLLTIGGTVANWIITPHKEFVFVNYLIVTCLASFVTLFLEIGRRLFLVSSFKDRLSDVLLDLIGASLVMKAIHGKMVDQDLPRSSITIMSISLQTVVKMNCLKMSLSISCRRKLRSIRSCVFPVPQRLNRSKKFEAHNQRMNRSRRSGRA